MVYSVINNNVIQCIHIRTAKSKSGKMLKVLLVIIAYLEIKYKFDNIINASKQSRLYPFSTNMSLVHLFGDGQLSSIIN